jgi:hypothetical protein
MPKLGALASHAVGVLQVEMRDVNGLNGVYAGACRRTDDAGGGMKLGFAGGFATPFGGSPLL